MFADDLNRLMMRKSMSQAALARKAGIPQSTLQTYCKGRYQPNLSKRKLLAMALGEEPNYFENLPKTTEERVGEIKLNVTVVAKLLHKSKDFVRKCLKEGLFPWATVVKINEYNSYYFSPQGMSDATGIPLEEIIKACDEHKKKGAKNRELSE